MIGLCQRCSGSNNDWTMKQAEFNVGRINHWKVQLCDDCTKIIEQALLAALRQVIFEKSK